MALAIGLGYAWPMRPTASAILVFWLVLLGACAEAPTAAAPDVVHDVVVLPTFGQRCDVAQGCAKGLLCLQSDYAKEPWCTVQCDPGLVKNYCPSDQTSGKSAFCVQMPKDFQGPTAPLCLPICANVAECHGYDEQWEQCAKPAYKNATFITDLPTKVCQSPSANGQVKVDPVLCDWQDKTGTEPGPVEGKQACVALCKGLLKSCQLWPKGKTEACCGWACFQYLTPGGKFDNSRLSGPIKCLNKAYEAFSATPEVCTGWKDQCGELPGWVQAP